MFEKIFSELRGKNALVTGSSRGIGKALALAMAEAGTNVAVHFIEFGNNREQAEQVAREIAVTGVRYKLVEGDVSISEDAKRIVRDAEKGLNGTVDILINNAGKGSPKELEKTSLDDYEDICGTNMRSVFLFTQETAPKMKEKKWGRIINISSSASFTGGRSGPHYAGSKAGVIGLTRYFAANLCRDGITVNCLAPGPINTDMVKAYPPGGPMGQPQDVAVALICLISSGFINGHTLHINGGLYLS